MSPAQSTPAKKFFLRIAAAAGLMFVTSI